MKLLLIEAFIFYPLFLQVHSVLKPQQHSHHVKSRVIFIFNSRIVSATSCRNDSLDVGHNFTSSGNIIKYKTTLDCD